jgi:hypothetical protein
MQINRIEVRLGATVNVGDFQSIKTEIMVQADVERNEDPMEAYGKLAGFAQTAMVEGAKAGHPDKVRLMLGKDARLAEAASDNKKTAEAPAENGKKGPGRPKKEAAPKEAPKLSDTSGMDVGGLDKEDDLNSLDDPKTETGTDDDLDSLLGGGAEEPVTREQVQETLVRLVKKSGKPALLELLKKHGAPNLAQLPDDKFGAIKAAAEKMIADAG